jgi:hypothetical protein
MSVDDKAKLGADRHARTAHRFATYPGDTRDMVGNVYGPNTLGEHMTAVTAEFDPEASSTRVGFDFTQKGDASCADALEAKDNQ